MLKYIRGCILCLTILFGCAYVPPTYAASASLVLTQVQAAGTTGALQELVVIYNNSDENVDITDWCLRNKSNVEFACFTRSNQAETLLLPKHMFVTVASSAEASTTGFTGYTIIYSPTNQSSGSIVASNDTITLADSHKNAVDTHTWLSGITSGMLFSRQVQNQTPLMYLDTDQASDWIIQSPQFIPESGLTRVTTVVDLCLNIEGDQDTIPDGMVHDEIGDCHLVVSDPPLAHIQITELLPNAAGSDAGSEFIELYNPNDQSIDLSSYTLWYGPEFEKSVPFPAEASIPAKSYAVFTNSQIGYSLLNTSSRVRITDGQGVVVDETPSYDNPKDNIAWAYIDGAWEYTNQPTPGEPNRISVPEVQQAEGVVDQKPCAPNQFRSTETNRCRLIVTSSVTVTPCKDNQYRSEETNRCRTIASSDEPATCKEGQERNPDTNRCRTIKSVSKADYGVLGVQSSTSGNNVSLWLTVILIILLALVYTLWEWRYEIRKLFRRFKHFVRVRK